uniref:Uncharacterized protein n=1 Tax=Trichuris muris TaxID=70415 RepID=A0A5S6QSG0_TRIMR
MIVRTECNRGSDLVACGPVKGESAGAWTEAVTPEQELVACWQGGSRPVVGNLAVASEGWRPVVEPMAGRAAALVVPSEPVAVDDDVSPGSPIESVHMVSYFFLDDEGAVPSSAYFPLLGYCEPDAVAVLKRVPVTATVVVGFLSLLLSVQMLSDGSMDVFEVLS